MLEMLLTGWLCLPIAPINPVEQDTLASINLHVTAGVSSPGSVVSAGPEISAKCELLVVHPMVVRGGVDLGYNKAHSKLYPQGDLISTSFSLDAIYYRGTDHLLGYIGLGAVFGLYHFTEDGATGDSLRVNRSINSVDMAGDLGYRLTLGLRYKTSYSLELSITEISPDFVLNGSYADGSTSRFREETNTSNIKVTVGYLFQLSRR